MKSKLISVFLLMFIFSSCNEKTLESVSEMENTESSEMSDILPRL